MEMPRINKTARKKGIHKTTIPKGGMKKVVIKKPKYGGFPPGHIY